MLQLHWLYEVAQTPCRSDSSTSQLGTRDSGRYHQGVCVRHRFSQSIELDQCLGALEVPVLHHQTSRVHQRVKQRRVLATGVCVGLVPHLGCKQLAISLLLQIFCVR